MSTVRPERLWPLTPTSRRLAVHIIHSKSRKFGFTVDTMRLA